MQNRKKHWQILPAYFEVKMRKMRTGWQICTRNANKDTQALSHSYLELQGVGDLGPRDVIQEQNEQNKTMNKTK